MQANFIVNFTPHMQDVSKRTKMHLNELGLNRTEFGKRQPHRRQPPIFWGICYFSSFCNMGVRVNVTARLYILSKYACTIFRN